MKNILALIGIGVLSAIQSQAIDVTIQPQGGNVVLSWQGTSSTTYIVQYRDAFDGAHRWQTLASLQGQDGTTTYTDAMTMPSVIRTNVQSSSQSQTLTTTTRTISATSDSGDTAPQFPRMPPMPPGMVLPNLPIGTAGSLSMATASDGISLPGPIPQNEGIELIPTTRFYRVCQTGISIGLTEGQVVSGTIPLNLNCLLGTNQLATVVFLSSIEYPDGMPGTSFSNPSNAFWDTTAVSNGTYTVTVCGVLNDGTSISNSPTTITVSNAIWFLDSYDVAGLSVYIGAQTIYPNGYYIVDFYHNNGEWLGWVDGDIDSNGYLTFQGSSGPDGFSISVVDEHDNQISSNFVDLVYTLYPAGATQQSQRSVATTGVATANDAPVWPTLTKRVALEPSWNYQTESVVAYMGMYTASQTTGWEEVQSLMNHIKEIEDAWHPILPYTYRDYNPNLTSTTDWTNLLTNLQVPTVRDFIYLGHGSGTTLGDDNVTNILTSGWGYTSTNLQLALSNGIVGSNNKMNMHPFRFVFLDGCQTADGDWPLVFGIPKSKMKISDFVAKRGIRPRAFVGWEHKVMLAVDGNFQNPSVFMEHAKYVQAIWDTWNPGMGKQPRFTIAYAIENAKSAITPGLYWLNPWYGITLYGAGDLMIDK